MMRVEKGGVVIKCDEPECHAEVIQRTEEQAIEEASLLGWRFDADLAGLSPETHCCPDCQAGRRPAEAAAEMRYGAGRVAVVAPVDVEKGVRIIAPDGMLLGVALNSARRGERLILGLIAPGSGPRADSSHGLELEDAVVVGGRSSPEEAS